MKKYRVTIQQPRAKKMIGSGLLTVEKGDIWNGMKKKTYEIGNVREFEFEIEDEYDYIYDTTCNDGPIFRVILEYFNKDKTRQEVIYPVPEKV